MLRLNKKALYERRYELLLVILVIIASAVRILLIAWHWPVTNSDEGNMGILARHVAYNGEWPIFFYGLPYMGPLQGYVAALLFHIFSPTLFTLRLALIPFYIGFLTGVYFLTRLLYTHRLALASVVLFALGSDELFSRELKAVGEYPEMMAFTAWICLLVAWLVLTTPPLAESIRRTTPKRVLVYALLGLFTGLAIWVDLIILPFVATAALLLLLVCRRELRSRAGLALLLGLVLGLSPLLIYNVTAPFSQNSIAVLLNLHDTHRSLAGNDPWLLLRQISGTLTISLPLATGFSPLCPVNTMPLFGPLKIECLLQQGLWGLGYLVLLVLALWLAARALRRLWLQANKPSWWRLLDWTPELRSPALLHACRLLLLVGSLLTLLAYATSPSAAVFPTTSARYLTCILIALPAVLWPLWHGLLPELPDARLAPTIPGARQSRPPSIGLALRLLCLVLIASTFITGTLHTVQEAKTNTSYQKEEALVQKLLALGVTRFYSEYWTCNRLIFHSKEQLICISLDEQLNMGFNRYKPYEQVVQEAPNPAYVFPISSQQAKAFMQRLQHSGNTYRKVVQDDYVIYVPAKT